MLYLGIGPDTVVVVVVISSSITRNCNILCVNNHFISGSAVAESVKGLHNPVTLVEAVGNHWSGSTVLCKCDNQNVVSRTSCDKQWTCLQVSRYVNSIS